MIVGKEVVNFDGYSTPEKTFRSKISDKRLIKSSYKTENQISKQVVCPSQDSQKAVSRGTIPRFSISDKRQTNYNAVNNFTGNLPTQ